MRPIKLLLSLSLLLSAPLFAEEIGICSNTADTTSLDAILFGNNGIKTDGVVILRDGCIVYERYGNGWKREQRHHGWSMAKGVTSVLAGIAVQKGYLDVEDFIDPSNSDPRKARIKVRHLLEWSSGLSFNEGYESDGTDSDVMRMLYTSGSGDMGNYTLSLPISYEPGLHHYYSSGDSTLLMAYLKKALGESYGTFPQEFFETLGMRSAVFERDRSGTYVGSSYVYATPRDWARFGQFLLQNGSWNGQQILPDWWMTKATETNPSYFTTPVTDDMRHYVPGWQFFNNNEDPSRGVSRPWPGATPETYMTSGHWGQLVAVIPEHKLVIVRLGNDRDSSLDKNLLYATVIQTFGGTD